MKFKEIIEKSQKKSGENTAGKSNIIGYWIWKSIAYFFVWILVPTSITPNMVSFISMICAIIGFVLLCLSQGLVVNIIGIIFFMLWAILDNVDGCLARIKEQFSPIGDLWDAAAGYVAMSLMFFGFGICAYNSKFESSVVFVILGGLTAITSLIPRLLMHFKYHGETNEINDQRSYDLIKIIAFNFISPDGLVLPLMLAALLLKIESAFIFFYFCLYLFVCIYTCTKLLKE